MANDAETKPSRPVQSRSLQLRLALVPVARRVRHHSRRRKAAQPPSVRVGVAVAPLRQRAVSTPNSSGGKERVYSLCCVPRSLKIVQVKKPSDPLLRASTSAPSLAIQLR